MPAPSARNLEELLRDHAGLIAPMGGATAIDREALTRGIGKLDQYLKLHYRVMLILLTSLFSVSLVLALSFVNSPERAAAVIGVLGLSAGGVVKRLGDTGKQIASLRLVAALASALNTDQLALVVQALAVKL